MTASCSGAPDGRSLHRNAGAFRAAGWLSLAAAPTFAIMALLTGVLGEGMPMLCSAGQGASPLGSMAAMYVLMSAFHLTPWLKLISARQDAAGVA